MSAALKLDLNAENRRTQRRTVIEDARIVNKRGGWSLINCTVRDISEGGAKLQIGPSVEIPTYFDLLLVKEMQIIPVRIRWRRWDFMGVQFTGPVRDAPPFV
jgi:PilZ domain-containing protein